MRDETRIVGNLPNLRMEIVHRQDPDGQAEHLSILLSARPSFEAAEGLLLAGLSGLPAWANPLALWSNMAQAVFAPWLGSNSWLAAAKIEATTPKTGE